MTFGRAILLFNSYFYFYLLLSNKSAILTIVLKRLKSEFDTKYLRGTSGTHKNI